MGISTLMQGCVPPTGEGTDDGTAGTAGGELRPAGAVSTDPKGMPVPPLGGAPLPAAVKLDPAGGKSPSAVQGADPLVPIPPPSNKGAGD
jgi:hypothetical protein